MYFSTVRKENKKTKRTNLWETVAIILSIGAIWPVVIWYNAKQPIPQSYYIVLFVVLAVLVYIMSRRIKRLRSAMRDAKNRGRQFPF